MWYLSCACEAFRTTLSSFPWDAEVATAQSPPCDAGMHVGCPGGIARKRKCPAAALRGLQYEQECCGFEKLTSSGNCDDKASSA